MIRYGALKKNNETNKCACRSADETQDALKKAFYIIIHHSIDISSYLPALQRQDVAVTRGNKAVYG